MAANPNDDLARVDTKDKKPDQKPHSDGRVPVYSELETTSADLSLAAILKGTAANPLTKFEKKAALINAEIDKFGIGRYQICIWFLCGFGYFLDLAWAQVSGRRWCPPSGRSE